MKTKSNKSVADKPELTPKEKAILAFALDYVLANIDHEGELTSFYTGSFGVVLEALEKDINDIKGKLNQGT